MEETPPSPKRLSIGILPTTDEDSLEVQTKSWSDLPTELLSPIADRLGIIELLSFRGACKDFRSASSTSSAQIESSPHRNPWLLLYGGVDTQCNLCSKSENKKYSINIPELEGSTCLASNHGWLLLVKEGGSIFFICPFSYARIDLPQFPHSDITDHIAAFSAPPTSQDCIVAVINRCDLSKMELNVIHRGANEWTKHEYRHQQSTLGTITCATYQDGRFYYLDNKNGALTFNVKGKVWIPYRIVDAKTDSDVDELPFGYKKGHFKNVEMRKLLELEEDVLVSICGTAIPGEKYDVVIHNESVTASSEESEMRPKLKGIWIHPRFIQILPDQSW